jgi:hypothetical protein
LPIGLVIQAIFYFFFTNTLLLGEALSVLFDPLDFGRLELPDF